MRSAIAADLMPRIEPGPSQKTSAPRSRTPAPASASTASTHSKMAMPASRRDSRQIASESRRHSPAWTQADAESISSTAPCEATSEFRLGMSGEHAPPHSASKTLANPAGPPATAVFPCGKNPALTVGATVP